MSGAQQAPLRTVDVAGASGYSLQQVRDLERLGVIPPAARSRNGYRSYAPLHVQALRAYRGLARAVGPVAARQLLTELRTATIAEAASAVSAVHVRLAQERDEALRAQQALHAIRAEGHAPTFRSASDAASTAERDTMTITQLAGALGVRPSTLRFWEQEGLVSPERVTSLRARRYGLSDIRAARIVAALRNAGYGIPAVREIIGGLRRLDGLGETERVLQQRLDQIAARTVALLEAGTDLAAVVRSAQRPPAAG
ncbi:MULTISPECIES: MerR family transcriptional regulator [unclassified Streptomyces]|uniref:MerR family transcriptional regulator n=1 Tax=unclassified Streptomyces TaxID=2593676 RepID=UPI0004772F1A|nr:MULTISPECIES: MerR family transcriptional regulator [unclassified Streptomyces]MYT29635.1 MerR family transcriptional regulator [Streptomyces sp. SID8354]